MRQPGKSLSLVSRIFIGLVLGLAIGGVVREWGAESTIAVYLGELAKLLGSLFVGALKAIAPILIFILVVDAISRHRSGTASHIRPVLRLYLIGTFAAALVAVSASFLFPSTLSLDGVDAAAADNASAGLGEVLRDLMMKLVANPVAALVEANYIGILMWSVLLGIALRGVGAPTIEVVQTLSVAISRVVGWIIRCAPYGIFGLVFTTVASEGFAEMGRYLQLLTVLVGCMLFVALVVNPLIVFIQTRKNPYPLVFTCLRESGITAFFTRSSAANIPVNMRLAQKLGLHEDTYSVAIPLGATINMAGAAITITVLTLAAANTLGIAVSFHTAFLLSIIATLGACGASGVAGGSLLLIPMACSLFNIDNDIAMQVVGVGFVISVVQDSFETALNSSTDVLFTAAVDQSRRDA